MPVDWVEEAQRSLAAGRPAAAFDTVRAALGELEWSVALLKSAGDLLAAIGSDEPAGHGLEVERVGVVGDCTTGTLPAALRCALAEDGRLAQLYEGPFGAYRQEILDPASGLHGFAPHTVLVVRSLRAFAGLPKPGESAEAVAARLASEVEDWQRLWAVLAERHGCRILQHELEAPAAMYVGPAERTHPASHPDFVARLNERLRAAAAGRVAWVETERAARRLGGERWAPADQYLHAKLPFNVAHLGAYARVFQGAWRLAANRTRKVLVTDLDHTLWGGVIGDDGLDGIALGPGSPAGEAYEAFGRYLVELGRRGVVLAVCSKNDPEVAIRVFREHPHMPLREEDFAIFHCSWNDKVSGLREIARALNLGLDALVLVDDNPAECALVRRELPEVVAVHLAGDPAWFPDRLERRQLFDRPVLTAEDVERGKLYHATAATEQLRAAAPDLDSFLAELRMEGQLDFAAAGDLDRLAQLESKTNQFNLTTARFSRADLDRFAASGEHDLLALRLRDRFADHGLVSAVVLQTVGRRLVILNWTLSCRVFSRGAEAFVLNRLLELCRARGLEGVAGSYRPTAKNGIVADLFARLGFGAQADGSWYLAANAPALQCRILDATAVLQR